MKTRNQTHTISAGSMADIAFLLLIFFMVTTTIVNDKGLTLLLPPDIEDQSVAPIPERNLFTISINSRDHLMVEGTVREDVTNLREEIQHFVLNYGRDLHLSDTPKKAVVSIKAARGTSHGMFIKVLDEAKAAYYEIYAKKAGITPAAFRNLANTPDEMMLYKKGSHGIPMNISIAEAD